MLVAGALAARLAAAEVGQHRHQHGRQRHHTHRQIAPAPRHGVSQGVGSDKREDHPGHVEGGILHHQHGALHPRLPDAHHQSPRNAEPHPAAQADHRHGRHHHIERAGQMERGRRQRDQAVAEQRHPLEAHLLDEEEGGNGARQRPAVEQGEDGGHLIDVGAELGGDGVDQHAELGRKTGHHEVGQEADGSEGELIVHIGSLLGSGCVQGWAGRGAYSAVCSASSIIWLKESCRSSAVVSSPVRQWSETVRMASASIPC